MQIDSQYHIVGVKFILFLSNYSQMYKLKSTRSCTNVQSMKEHLTLSFQASAHQQHNLFNLWFEANRNNEAQDAC